MIKIYFSLIVLAFLLACGGSDDNDPNPVDNDPPIEEEEEEEQDSTATTFNENVWIDPTIRGDEHADLKVHVWFESQLISFDDTYLSKAATYSTGRLALRQQLISELKTLNNASMLNAKDSIDSLVVSQVIHSVEPSWIVNGFTCKANSGGIAALSFVPGVHTIFRAFSTGPSSSETGPSFYTPSGADFSYDSSQDSVTWNVDSLNAPRVWNELNITGKGSKNVVHDFGFSFDVAAISESIYTNQGETPENGIDDDGNGYIDDYHGYDFENKTSKVNVGVPNGKGSIHGNSVATIICGRMVDNKAYGVAPDAKWAAIMGLSTYAENIEWALEMGFDTYTMSFSIPNLYDQRGYWRKISEHAALCGLFVISGAGNFGNALPTVQLRTPEDIPYAVFAVSGVDALGNLPAFSSKGPVNWDTHHYKEGDVMKPDFATYNFGVLSIDYNGNGNIALNGNSFAGPHLAGVISLMLEANPNLNVWEVREILKNIAKDIQDQGPDNKVGHGLVDAFKAVEAVI